MTATTTTILGTEAALDNALVNQKDSLIRGINGACEANDVDALRRVAFAVDTAKIVWDAVGYGYKHGELCDRLSSAFYAVAQRLFEQKAQTAGRTARSELAARIEKADAMAAFYRR